MTLTGIINSGNLKKDNNLIRREELKSYCDQLGETVVCGQQLAKIGFWIYEVQTGQVFWTEEIYHFLECESNELNEELESFLTYVHSDDLEIVKAATQDVLDAKEYDINYRIVTNNGQVKYLQEKTKVILDENYNPTIIVGSIQDITGAKILEQELKKSYKIINQAQSLVRIGSWEMDLSNHKIYFSDQAYRIYGITAEQYDNTYEGFKRFVHPDDIEKINQMLENPSRKPVELEFRIIRDGFVRDIRQLVEFIFDKDGNPIYVYGTIRDITENKELQKEIEINQEKINKMRIRFDALIKESIDVFEIIDSDGTIMYISEASEKIIGYKAEERLGKKIYEYYEESEKTKLREMVEFILNQPERELTRDVLFKKRTGKEIYLEIYMKNFLHDPAIDGIVVNFRDITNRVEAEKRIAHLSTHDQLTGLPNRFYFENKLESLSQYDKGTDNGFALFMLDIDSLRYINDTLGYKAGEKYIVQIAAKLEQYCGSTKPIYRYSDNRFVIVVKGIHSIDEYRIIIKEIYELFSQTIKIDKYELDVVVSMGICTCREDKPDSELLIRNAETALFFAKNEGKNKYKFYSPDIDIQSYKQFTLRNDLKNAIDNDQLRIYYQPIIDLKTNEILAAEALIRWEHPEWGMALPSEFIPIAEETGDIIKIGNWLFGELCRNYKQWLNSGLPNIKLSVNFSSMQFFETNFVEGIKNTIDEYGLDPHFLIMEITESVLVEKVDKLIPDIGKLQSLGIKIALDDFGTGYSSLTYLNSFNIDILKIDGSFIKKINLDKTSTIITRNIIKMAQELKIKLVAEHIETWEQLSFLKNLKCSAGQGHIFSKPVPAKDFEKVLAKGKCKPVVKDNAELYESRRRFFRVNFGQPLETDLTILEFKGREINVGNTKVWVKDIGPGGLCFISDIRLPIEKDIVLLFTTQLIGEEINVEGHSVWMEEKELNLFEYGVEFVIDENKRTDLVRILNQVQINMRKGISIGGV